MLTQQYLVARYTIQHAVPGSCLFPAAIAAAPSAATATGAAAATAAAPKSCLF